MTECSVDIRVKLVPLEKEMFLFAKALWRKKLSLRMLSREKEKK